MDQKYKCILADPPWQIKTSGNRQRSKGQHSRPTLDYPTMTLEEIKKLPIGDLAHWGCHLWLWTTNQTLPFAFDVMTTWGFKYLAPVHWIKPSGVGNWFVSRTQTLLFGYKGGCEFPLKRYRPNIIEANTPKTHSAKPIESYNYIESISPGPRLELFARRRIRDWSVWGNQVESDITLSGDWPMITSYRLERFVNGKWQFWMNVRSKSEKLAIHAAWWRTYPKVNKDNIRATQIKEMEE